MASKIDSSIEGVREKLNNFIVEQNLKGSKKWGSLQQRVRWVLTQITEAVVYLGIGIVEAIVTIILKSYTVFPLLFYGIILVVARWLILQLMALLIIIAVIPVDIINAILEFLDIGINIAIYAIDVVLVYVNMIIDVIKYLDPHLHVKDVQLIKWVHLDFLSITEFKYVLQTTITTCKRFDSFNSIALFLMRMGLHEYTCAATRYMYPVTWIFDTVNAVLGWSFYGVADPFPLEPDANCAANEANTVYDDVCCGLGIGFLFLEFFLPTVLVYIVLRSLASSFFKFANLFFYMIEVGIILFVDAGVIVFEELFE